MTWIRLALRLQRFEVVALVVLVVGWTLAALLIAWRLSGFVAEYPDCFGLTTTIADYCEDASLIFGPWDQMAEVLLWLALGLPLFMGVVLGAPIVARELEQQTAQLAWSLALSRLRWLAGRTRPIGIAAIILFAVLAVGGEILAVARLAGDDPGFQRYDQRGLLVVVRGLVATAVAVLLGAWLGRTLPAILASAALATFLVFGLVVALDAWRRAEAEIVPINAIASDAILRNGMIIEPVAVLPDGTIISGRSMELPDGASFDALRVIPSSEYWTWVGREAGVLAMIMAATLAGAGAVVQRRRPL